MPTAEQLRIVVREWLRFAVSDLNAAEHLCALRDESLAPQVGFHAQQCVEKSLKALLVKHQRPVERHHDIERLFRAVDPSERPHLATSVQRRLGRYATVERYPGALDPPDQADADAALAAARLVHRHVLAVLEPFLEEDPS
ncbi:MAG: HEPN domain-containing protein [Armatimonadetes bacterium]|nr:HEPN domain-containing protein [Armatimonadota bacterium]